MIALRRFTRFNHCDTLSKIVTDISNASSVQTDRTKAFDMDCNLGTRRIITKWSSRRKITYHYVLVHVRTSICCSELVCSIIRRKSGRYNTELLIRRGRLKGSANYRRGQSNWIKDYVSRNPTYPDGIFQRRFAIPRLLYYYIRSDLLRFNYSYWRKQINGIGYKCIPTDVKILSALRILSTGCSYDSLDDAVYMSEESIRQCFNQFINDIVRMYGPIFFNRRPTSSELTKISNQYADHGFPGCIGCVDCTKLVWKNCPYRKKGQFLNSRVSKMATIQCEAWCDKDLYCWSWFSGRPGTNNDLNVLSRSPLFNDIFNDWYKPELSQPYRFLGSNDQRKNGYFLVDSIYPRWPYFVGIADSEIFDPRIRDKFSGLQESQRKDVERLFGVLQSRFEILRKENRRTDLNHIITLGNTCIILHNITIRMKQHFNIDDHSMSLEDIRDIMQTETVMANKSINNIHRNMIRNNYSVLEDEEEEEIHRTVRDLLHTDEDSHEQLVTDLMDHQRHFYSW